jgi:NTE family protein
MADSVADAVGPEAEVAEPGEVGSPARTPQPGVGLCLSGGGYRAMLFHLGALWRLNEFGLLPRLRRVSSVSGGSITAALLGLRWKELGFDAAGVASQFDLQIVVPLRNLASHTIDVGSVASGLLDPFGGVADRIHAAYRRHLYGNATLQDLPDPPAPHFVLNATNVQTGALWRFAKPYMGDYRVGLSLAPTTPLALAVTASSAFPPFLSPVRLPLKGVRFEPDDKADLQRAPFTTEAVLSDGGGYDNLGLETVFKRLDTVLVSDGGAKIVAEEEPHSDWPRHAYRILQIIDDQVRNLRRRTLLAAYQDRSGNPLTARKGAYWGIRTRIAEYQLDSALNAECPPQRTRELAEIPTRLAELADETQERLINWGYAVCDAAVRTYWPPAPAAGGQLPQPRFPYDRGV